MILVASFRSRVDMCESLRFKDIEIECISFFLPVHAPVGTCVDFIDLVYRYETSLHVDLLHNE